MWFFFLFFCLTKGSYFDPDYDLNTLTTAGVSRQNSVKSGLSDPLDWMKATLPKDVKLSEVVPKNNVQNLRKPVLIISSIYDDNVLVQRSVDFVERAVSKQKSQFISVYFHSQGRSLPPIPGTTQPDHHLPCSKPQLIP